MNCIRCKKPSIALFEGGLCKVCNAKQEKSSPEKLAYNLERTRKLRGTEIGLFAVEYKGQYKIQRCMVNGVRLAWGDKKQAKIYQSRKMAEYAVRMIGKGKVEKL